METVQPPHPVSSQPSQSITEQPLRHDSTPQLPSPDTAQPLLQDASQLSLDARQTPYSNHTNPVHEDSGTVQQGVKEIQVIKSKMTSKDEETELLNIELKAAYHTINQLQQRVTELEKASPPPPSPPPNSITTSISDLQDRVTILEEGMRDEQGLLLPTSTGESSSLSHDYRNLEQRISAVETQRGDKDAPALSRHQTTVNQVTTEMPVHDTLLLGD